MTRIKFLSYVPKMSFSKLGNESNKEKTKHVVLYS